MSYLAQHWYYFVPTYLLAALMWTLLGRFVLGLFVPEDWPNYIWQFFRRTTDPVLALVARITPRFMVEGLMPLVAVFWVAVARILFHLVMYRLGLTPPVELGPAP